IAADRSAAGRQGPAALRGEPDRQGRHRGVRRGRLRRRPGPDQGRPQHAVRQAKTLAGNVAAAVHGGTLRDYRHAYAGSVASLGLYRGVAEVYGIKLRGPLAWFLHRTYHLSRVPTFNRKVRVLADWTAALFFPREVVSMGQLQMPRHDFEQAAAS